MTIQRKKQLAWFLTTGGFGATLLFAVVILLNGRGLDRHEWPGYLWPLAGVTASIWGWKQLGALYRIEPPIPPAAWTVSIADLICGTVFAGVCGAAASEDLRFKELTTLAAVTGFALYMGSALAASLHGVIKSALRPAYIVAHACATLGLMGVMSLLLILCIMPLVLNPSEIMEFLSELLLLGSLNRDWMVVLRAMLCALPVGLVALTLMNAVAGGGKKEAPR